jgi:hypothetical protein
MRAGAVAIAEDQRRELGDDHLRLVHLDELEVHHRDHLRLGHPELHHADPPIFIR